MSRVSTYLNFAGDTEEAFTFYASVFGTEFSTPIMRIGEMPAAPGAPAIADHELSKVMHVELPILDGHVLMGTDMLESLGQVRRIGNNTTINLEPDSTAETERLFAALSEGGSDTAGLDPMPWGSLWGVTLDRFGIRWMFNVDDNAD